MQHAIPDNTTSLRGEVERIFFSSASFCAGRFLTKGGASVPFAGNIAPREHEPLVLHGKFVKHPKYGQQFEVASMEFDQRLDADGLANYLANNPDIKGIGPAKARVIADRFGSDFERVLINTPEQIAETAKLPLPVIEDLRNRWLETSETNTAMTALAAYGLTHHQLTKLVKKLGNSAVGIIERDPYVIVGEIDGFGFKRIDKIARQVGTEKDDPSRIRAGIVFCVDDALDRGDCWVEYEELLDRANTLLVMDCLDSRARIELQLDDLVDKDALTCYAADSRFLVAKPVIRHMEESLASVFAEAKKPNPHCINQVNINGYNLNVKQIQAVNAAIRHKLSLISGGAGVGKSYVCRAITDIYSANDLRVTLCAPTGKAAKRMVESTGRDASTIHRLLGFNGTEYSHDAEHPLSTDVLILDEISMLDVPLAWRLFQAIDLSRTAVVLVGDQNQLPPVGPGNVLRDLIDSRALPTTILDEVVRQAGILKENSIAILRGEVPKTPQKDHADHGAWYVVDQHSKAEDVQQFILDLFEHTLPEKLGFDILRDVQVLTPTHKGTLGTIELNARLQQLIQRKLWGNDIIPVPPDRRPKLYVNDKVIQTRNNYQLGVMNGAMGIVRSIGVDGALSIEFDGIVVRIEASSPHRNDIQLAYALTIHKCVSKDTLIPTADGLLPIEELASGIPEKTSVPRGIQISTLGGIESTESFYSGGMKPLIRLRTRSGYEISGSHEHPVLTANADGFHWKLMPEIRKGDVIVFRRGTANIQTNADPVIVQTSSGGTAINEQVAWILGVLVGIGDCTDEYDGRVEIMCKANDLILRYAAETERVLGVKAAIVQAPDSDRMVARYESKAVRDLLYRCGIGYDSATAKRIPSTILRSPCAIQAAFLRGLFDAKGAVCKAVTFSTVSRRLGAQVQLLLLHHGIVSRRCILPKMRGRSVTPIAWRLEITQPLGIHLFRSMIGFGLERKQSVLDAVCQASNGESAQSCIGSVPFGRNLIREFREELRSRGWANYPEAKAFQFQFSKIVRGASRLNYLHLDRLSQCIPEIATIGKRGQEIRWMSEMGIFFDPVVELRNTEEYVYDMSVPGSHSFVGNGIVNHNCQGSEFPCSIVITHKSHSFMHHRNLLYTGVTRACKTAIIVGDRWGIANCAKRMQVDARKTFLSLILAGG